MSASHCPKATTAITANTVNGARRRQISGSVSAAANQPVAAVRGHDAERQQDQRQQQVGEQRVTGQAIHASRRTSRTAARAIVATTYAHNRPNPAQGLERAARRHRRDRQPRRGRQVRADLVALGQHVDDHGHDEEHERERRDRGGGVAQQRAEREPESAHRRQEEPAAEDGAGDVRVGERGVDVLGGEDRLAGEERQDARDRAEDERDREEHAELAPQHREATRDGGERGADRAGRVLAGDDHRAEHAERDLREVDAAEAALDRVVAGGRRAVAPVGDAQPGDEHAEADDEAEGDQQREAAGTQRVQLRELGRDHARVGDGGHAAASYSTASRVSSMNASSSEAWRVESSCSVRPCARRRARRSRRC